ncbi:hypothetical protein QZH41_012328 [Actinostola sp. cb2023]|nr:hypothetical protein QZH41_012328 [Actinostola sp. cb2023]
MTEVEIAKKDDARVNLVKEVLMSLLRQAVNTDAVEKIKDILLTCREHNRSVCHVLTPWACQHICDMARTMTVHCEPLMFASEELFKCYKEKLNQTILENQRVNNLEGSLGLNRLFSEGHEEDNEAEPCKPCTPLNPYSTHTPHPFLELSFDLGIMGLNAVSKEDNAELRRCHAGRYNRGKKEHLKQLCDLVCYITTRKWLNQTPHDQIPIDVERRDRIPPLADSPQETDESYLTRFVTDLLESDASPMLLMSLLCEMTHKLRVIDDTKRFEDNHNTKQELLRHVLSLVPNLRLMMERIKSKFRNLLLGPKVNDLVKKITERRRRESNDLRADFEYQQLEDETFRDTLMAAKDAYEVGDPSGVSFKKLADEMEKQHKELKAVLEGVLSGEEFSRPRDEEVFRNNPFFFWPFITQELPFIRRHPLEDWLN